MRDPADDRNLPAQYLFGRGFPQVAWQFVLALFVGGAATAIYYLVRIMVPGLRASLPPQIQFMESNFVSQIMGSAIFAFALSWMLANVRSLGWLCMGMIGLNFLTSEVMLHTEQVWALFEGRSPSWVSSPFIWGHVGTEFVFGFTAWLATLAALKLRHGFYFLIPFCFTAAHCASALIYTLVLDSFRGDPGHNLRVILLSNLGLGVISGLAFWIGFEFQRRKPITRERPEDKRLTNGAYLFWPACVTLLGVPLLRRFLESGADTDTALLLAGGLAIGVGVVMIFVFLYRAWDAIQTPFTTSAGSVIGQLFIPLYNLYWVFRAFPGFASEYENTALYYQLNLPPVPRLWLIVYVLAGFASAIPVVGPLLSWLQPLAGAVAFSHIADAVNRLPQELPTPNRTLSLP